MGLCIKGDAVRGGEVIATFQMLGYANYYGFRGDEEEYYFGQNGEIIGSSSCEGFDVYDIASFERKFPFRVGETVVMKNNGGRIGEVIDIYWDSEKRVVKFVVEVEGEVFVTEERDLEYEYL